MTEVKDPGMGRLYRTQSLSRILPWLWLGDWAIEEESIGARSNGARSIAPLPSLKTEQGPTNQEPW